MPGKDNSLWHVPPGMERLNLPGFNSGHVERVKSVITQCGIQHHLRVVLVNRSFRSLLADATVDSTASRMSAWRCLSACHRA